MYHRWVTYRKIDGKEIGKKGGEIEKRDRAEKLIEKLFNFPSPASEL